MEEEAEEFAETEMLLLLEVEAEAERWEVTEVEDKPRDDDLESAEFGTANGVDPVAPEAATGAPFLLLLFISWWWLLDDNNWSNKLLLLELVA